jgi:gluconate 2-dehydrogenase gamma chain
MSNETSPARRQFLKGIGVASGATLAAPGLIAVPSAAEAQIPKPSAETCAPPAPYQSLGPDEASCLEAIVNVMCPADRLTPNGEQCGLATFIDHQLAGSYGRGDRLYRQGPWVPGKPQHGYQSALSPEEFFKAGLKALQAECFSRTSKSVQQLQASELEDLLRVVAQLPARADAFPLTSWFNEVLYPLFVQACFSDPMYGGNKDKVFWKLVGYPGLPAVHQRNVIEFRGKRFPGSKQPKSIANFV